MSSLGGGIPVPGPMSLPGKGYPHRVPYRGAFRPVHEVGYPGHVRMGYPLSGGWEYHPWAGVDGVPLGQVRMGYPLARSGWGTPSPRRQSSRASTCYAVGGMLLSFNSISQTCFQQGTQKKTNEVLALVSIFFQSEH